MFWQILICAVFRFSDTFLFSSPLACTLCTLPCCCFKILTPPSRESGEDAGGGLGRKIELYSEAAISVHFHGDQPNGTKNNLGTLNKPITRKVKSFIVPETCHLHEKIVSLLVIYAVKYIAVWCCQKCKLFMLFGIFWKLPVFRWCCQALMQYIKNLHDYKLWSSLNQ